MHFLIPFDLLIFTTQMFSVLGRHVQLEGNDGLYEGDIATKTSFPPNANSSVKLGAIRDTSKLWPGGKVPYRIDTESIPNVKDQRVILLAMETLSNLVTCLEFQDNQVANKFDYVRIAGDGDQTHSSTGCWSYVGMQGGEQTLNLGSGCFTEELVLHELLHLLGIVHEQNRPDRDDFVEIMWSNIQPGMEGQFEKRNESEVTMQNTPYDFRSRMHYPEQSFSKSSAPTILARYPGDDNFGPVDKLSVTDVVEISLLYRCEISSRVAVKYSHVNRYANEVRIELVWDELDAMNATTNDKFCEIEDKLEEISTSLSFKNDKDNKSSYLESKVDETVIKVDSCGAQIQLIKQLFETNNNLLTTKNEQLNDKITVLEETMERKWNEFVGLVNAKDSEIEELKKKISNIGDCKLSSWSEYSDCSVTHCGSNGTKTRTRSIQHDGPNGAQCFGDTSQIVPCSGNCDPVQLYTDIYANYIYYKVPVLESSKMTADLVFRTCSRNGMKAQCFRADYADNNCVQAPSTSINKEHPKALSKILCDTTSPQGCAFTLNMFWYMKSWSSGSACGATKDGFCSGGNSYTSTSDNQYFAACLKPI